MWGNWRPWTIGDLVRVRRQWAQSWERGWTADRWSEGLRVGDERLEWSVGRWSEGWLATTGGGEIREVERRERKKKSPKKQTGRNAHTDRNTPKFNPRWNKGVVSYRFAYRYEIFCLFRPERNGIYNSSMTSNFFQELKAEFEIGAIKSPRRFPLGSRELTSSEASSKSLEIWVKAA